MAVCNLFNTLENVSGNFLMFSQYVEDVTKGYTNGDSWKVIPNRFVVLNIDYSNINRQMVTPNGETLNEGIPKYFQNCFENACAYGRVNYVNQSKRIANTLTQDWTPEISRNLFWNFMFDGGFLTSSPYGDTRKVNEVMYWDDISIQSYDEHNGMGFGEIYCYIPSNSPKKNCQVIRMSDIDMRIADLSNDSIFLEGFKDRYVENYSKEYYYNRDFSMTFDDPDVGVLNDSQDAMYGFNTVVVLYDIVKKEADGWKNIYTNIPMGMYITGRFDGTELTNAGRKYVTSSYGVGTSYGLRICTRFSVAPNGMILSNNETIIDNEDITTVCQLMSKMSENLSLMMSMSQQMNDTTQQYKELLSTIKNNRTNVPYVKVVNGNDWWFVNGRPVTNIDNKYEDCCNEVSVDMLEERIENIKKTLADDNPNNDYMDFNKIYDGRGCECEEQPIENVVEHIQTCLDKDFEWNGEIPDCVHDFEFATDDEIFNILDGASDGSNDWVDYQIATDKEVADYLKQSQNGGFNFDDYGFATDTEVNNILNKES